MPSFKLDWCKNFGFHFVWSFLRFLSDPVNKREIHPTCFEFSKHNMFHTFSGKDFPSSLWEKNVIIKVGHLWSIVVKSLDHLKWKISCSFSSTNQPVKIYLIFTCLGVGTPKVHMDQSIQSGCCWCCFGLALMSFGLHCKNIKIFWDGMMVLGVYACTYKHWPHSKRSPIRWSRIHVGRIH